MVGGGEVEGAGRWLKGGRERNERKKEREREKEDQSVVAGRRETRHETATERRARLHKASEWDLPGPRY